MKDISKRATEIAEYIIDTKCTVRQAAKHFNISKSTVHKDVTERLEAISARLFSKVTAVIRTNKAQRHIRGGEKTRLRRERLRDK